MAKTTHTRYIGDLRTEIEHLQSGNKITTDAPLDNNGKGEFFSPTDMLAASLGSCMLTIMGMAAKTHGFDIDGTKVDTTKIMESNPRRVAEVIVEFQFPYNYEDKHKRLIEAAARHCPVANSLHPDLKQTIVFNYAGK